MSRAIDADALKEQIESHVVSMSVCLSVDEHYGKVTPDVAFELAKTGLTDPIDPDTANKLGIEPK